MAKKEKDGSAGSPDSTSGVKVVPLTLICSCFGILKPGKVYEIPENYYRAWKEDGTIKKAD